MAGVPQALIDEFVIAAHGDLAKVQALAEQHPELLTARASWHETPLQAAAHTGNQVIVRYLLARGLEPDVFTAAVLGDVDGVAAWLDRDPALADARGAHGIPLLFHAAMAGRREVCALLLERGVDVNTGAGGNTALHAAALRGDAELARWLLERGADVHARDYEGKTPLDRALAAGHEAVAEVLRRAGGEETPRPA